MPQNLGIILIIYEELFYRHKSANNVQIPILVTVIFSSEISRFLSFLFFVSNFFSDRVQLDR